MLVRRWTTVRPALLCMRHQEPGTIRLYSASYRSAAFSLSVEEMSSRGSVVYKPVNGSVRGSETWPVSKENVVALQRAEMRMVRWVCGVKLKDRFPSKELRERLGVDDIALVLHQNRLRLYVEWSAREYFTM